MGGSHGNDAGFAAAGGGNDAINGVYHVFSSCKQYFLLPFKAIQHKSGMFSGIIIQHIAHSVNDKPNDSAKEIPAGG